MSANQFFSVGGGKVLSAGGTSRGLALQAQASSGTAAVRATTGSRCTGWIDFLP